MTPFSSFKNPAIDTMFALAQDAAKSDIAPNEAIEEIFDLTAFAHRSHAHLPERRRQNSDKTAPSSNAFPITLSVELCLPISSAR